MPFAAGRTGRKGNEKGIEMCYVPVSYKECKYVLHISTRKLKFKTVHDQCLHMLAFLNRVRYVLLQDLDLKRVGKTFQICPGCSCQGRERVTGGLFSPGRKVGIIRATLLTTDPGMKNMSREIFVKKVLCLLDTEKMLMITH